jgi:F420-non-reducing hydrogenase iron-sulfur subunit
MINYEPRLICFSCKFSWGYLTDETVLARQMKNWVPIICSGKVSPSHILNAFKRGADGVLILGCGGGDCHYQDGNYEAKKRVYLLHKVLESYGIEKERLRIELSADPEGEKIPQLVKEMSERLKKLGPLKGIIGRVETASTA